MSHVREHGRRCLECAEEHRGGVDLPVCHHADPAGEPNEWLCAWCGHEVAR